MYLFSYKYLYCRCHPSLNGSTTMSQHCSTPCFASVWQESKNWKKRKDRNQGLVYVNEEEKDLLIWKQNHLLLPWEPAHTCNNTASKFIYHIF